MSDFFLFILFLSGAIMLYVGLVKLHLEKRTIQDRYLAEKRKFFKNMRKIQPEGDLRSIFYSFKDYTEVKRANKRIQKAIKKHNL